MADSIESLAEIIKDCSRKHRKLNDRLGDVEVKLFGQNRDERKKAKLNTSNISQLKNSVNGLAASINNKENSFSRVNRK